MIRYLRWSLCLTSALLFAFVALPGCNSAKDGKKHDHDKKEDKHAHADVGPHGGPFADWDDYHAEFIVTHTDKHAVIYLLDEKLEKAPKVDASRFSKVRLVITSVKPAVAIDFKHDPKLSGELGIAYVATHEELGKPVEIKGVISATLDENVKGKEKGFIDDKFHYKGPQTDKDKKKAAKLRELYLTPGGLYTLADIKANGNTTAAEKFQGKVWAHDDNLKVGDRICPVTKNKAEAECAWTVQGQSYQFCCPPCVDKFVGWAHNQPDKIKDAKTYVFQGM